MAEHLAAVADRLNQAARSGALSRRLSIDCVGFRWRSRAGLAWPVADRITWNSMQAAYKATMSKRWGWESGRHYLFRASGRSQDLAQTLLRDSLHDVDLRSKTDTAAALIAVLRSLPPQDPTVSKDCLVTTIQRVSPHVHLKYEPYDIQQATVAFTGRTVIVPASFTPWIITLGQLATPQVITRGGYTHHSGGLDITVVGPNPEGDLRFMSTQWRRQWAP